MTVNVTYREPGAVVPGSTTIKNSPLSNAEIDGNFKSVKDAVEVLSTTGGAALIGVAPVGGVAATTVQAAISELDSEKAGLTALAAPSGSSLVGYTPAGTGAVGTTTQSKLRQLVSVFDFMTDTQITDVQSGAATVDVTAAIQSALTSGKSIYVPEGVYLVTSTLFLPDGATIIGAGRQKSIIKSGVIGASLFSTNTDPVACIYMADMQLRGNGLTGSLGNGHAINLIDPNASGAWSPQACTFERLRIVDFRGQDNCDRTGVKKISAAGICMYEPLGIVMREILCTRTGHGIYAHLTQNCRIENCIVDSTDKFAIFAYDNEQLTVVGCDLINSSDGVLDSGYPEAGLPTGMIGSFRNEGFVLRQNKVKGNKSGKAAIVVYESIGDVIDMNWLRGDAQTDIPHKTIFADRSPGLKITNNTFSPSQTSFAATRPYENIELYNTITARSMTAEITGNYFIDTQIHQTAYNIRLNADNAVRSFVVTICGNLFGRSSTNPQTTTIQKDIDLTNCTLTNSVISNNTFHAAANVTRSLCVSVSSVTLSSNTIGPNRFESNGGTLTTEYSGIFPSVLNKEVAYDAPPLADGEGTTTTVTCTGARLGDFAEASFSSGTLGGAIVAAWVSASDTVSIRLQNETGGAIDLSNQSLRVRVRGRLSA